MGKETLLHASLTNLYCVQEEICLFIALFLYNARVKDSEIITN